LRESLLIEPCLVVKRDGVGLRHTRRAEQPRPIAHQRGSQLLQEALHENAVGALRARDVEISVRAELDVEADSLTRYPADKVTVIVLSNIETASANKIADKLGAMMFGVRPESQSINR
jgi:DNA-directed RNA polymerase specialized sigma24 family protein